jgi:hypothetical protein
MTVGAGSDRSEELLRLAMGHLRTLRSFFRSRGVRLSTQGDFPQLVIAFAWKQEDHAEAILALAKHRDVQLVARSMVEGLCQLKWVANDPEPRAQRWRLFGWVHDWRLMQRDFRAGRPVPPEKQAEIERGIREHGPMFERKDADKRRKRGRDPYVSHWSGATVAALCDSVNGKKLYEWAYAPFSDWHHWSPGGLATAFKTSGNKISFPPPSAQNVLGSFVVAFQCLFETLEVANNTFKLGFDVDLETIREQYLRDLTSNPDAPDPRVGNR